MGRVPWYIEIVVLHALVGRLLKGLIMNYITYRQMTVNLQKSITFYTFNSLILSNQNFEHEKIGGDNWVCMKLVAIAFTF